MIGRVKILMISVLTCMAFAASGPFAWASTNDCASMLGQLIIVTPFPPPHQNDPISNKIGGVLIPTESIADLHTSADVANFVSQFRGSGRLISFDQEGGAVQRLNAARGFQTVPRPREQGEQARRWGGVLSKDVVAVGGNLNFSTVIDICVEGSPIIDKYGRCFSKEPREAARLGLESALGNSENGVIPTFKHFPGHGSSRDDSHLGDATVQKNMAELETSDLVPFEIALAEFRTKDDRHRDPAVMVGHIRYPNIPGMDDLPASLNPQVVTGLLRERLKFDGLIISDDLGYMKAIWAKFPPKEAAERALLAGENVLIFSNLKAHPIFKSASDQDELLDEVCRDAQPGSDLLESIKDSYARVLQAKQAYGIGPDSSDPRAN